ncbi:hypothetical protein STEG23_027261 [Scotinomys teguina]
MGPGLAGAELLQEAGRLEASKPQSLTLLKVVLQVLVRAIADFSGALGFLTLPLKFPSPPVQPAYTGSDLLLPPGDPVSLPVLRILSAWQQVSPQSFHGQISYTGAFEKLFSQNKSQDGFVGSWSATGVVTTKKGTPGQAGLGTQLWSSGPFL